MIGNAQGDLEVIASRLDPDWLLRLAAASVLDRIIAGFHQSQLASDQMVFRAALLSEKGTDRLRHATNIAKLARQREPQRCRLGKAAAFAHEVTPV